MSGTTLVVASLEEWQQNSATLWKDISQKEKDKLQKQWNEYIANYDLHILWDKWMNWRKNHPTPGFLFRKQPTDSRNLFNVNMINIREAVWTLEKYYELFQRELKMEFDPLEVIMEFEKEESNFWNAVFSNDYLLGILYGFGERNSFFFSKEINMKQKTDRDEFLFASFPVPKDPKKSPIGEFSLPVFRSYEINQKEDPILKQFKEERQQIKQLLKGKDPFQEVLWKLHPKP